MARRTISEEIKTERRNALIDTLKSLIFPVVLCLIFGIGILLIIKFQSVETPEDPIPVYAYAGDEKPVVMENDSLKFEMDPITTQFTLTNKENGQVWYSNPDGAEADALALPEEKNNLRSTVLMSYSITSGLEVTYNSYEYSVLNGIYEIEQPDDETVLVHYSMGKVQKEFTIPLVTTKKEFDSWCDKMDSKDAEIVKQYYKKYSLKKIKDEEEKQELLANYPIIEKKTIYVLRDTTKDNMKQQIENIFTAAGYTYEDYISDKEYDHSTTVNENPVFNITMEYSLDGDDFKVRIPMEEMAYLSKFPMYTITPLPYFGAGGDDDTGYMFVPEGGGATISFNNGKTSQNSYYVNMYGWDMCISRDAVVHNTEAYYGVYGIARDNGSFICILEDGNSYAGVQADIAGKNNSYNYVNAKFSLNQREQYDVGDIANSDVYEYTPSLPNEDISMRYSFVSSTNYVDMAKDYGKYLQNRYGSYLAMNDENQAPVVVEVVGAVDKVKQIMGVPTSRPLALTTYNEATDMIKELKEDGLENMSVKLVGWCNGGVKQKLLKHVRPIGSLGSKKDLKNLTATANDLGVDLYLNGVTQYEYNSNLLDGFFSYRDAAKLISKERCELHEYSSITFSERDDLDAYYLLHTELAGQMSEKLADTAKSYNAGVSFEDDGIDLSADYYKKNMYSRQAVLKLQEERFKNIDDSGMKVMINMGNDYAAPFADIITNMDLSGSEYTILDSRVPFYQLALHGYITYTGKPINICGDEVEELLNCAEYGAGLQYTLMDESAFTLQKTLYTEYYGSTFDSAKDSVVETYNRYNAELGHVFDQEMTNHENITADLAMTEYADGTKVYVNYGYDDAAVEGITVPARDYLVVR